MIFPDTATLVVFAIACLALYITPGPDMLYIASRSLGQGRRAGIWSACGVCTGLLAHTLGAAFGLGALLVVWPLGYAVIRWLGVAYLIYLGVRILTQRDSGAVGAGPPLDRADPWRTYVQGALINLLNPKIALFFLAFLPQFVDETRGAAAQMVLLGALFTAGGLAWSMFLAVAFGAAGDWLARHPAVWRWQRRLSGGTLIGLGLHLAVTGRR